MNRMTKMSVVGLLSTLMAAPSMAAVIDGTIGAEWAGVTPEVATYDANAPTSNFQTPGNTNHLTGYDIYLRSDSQYVYVGLEADDATAAAGVFGANLYFGTDTSTTGSNVGFEVGNWRAFAPGVAGYYDYTAASGIEFVANAAAGTIEFAVPVTFFTEDPLNIGFNKANASVTLRLSQSFGYSVIGGADAYGPDRLGTVAVPEPASLALLALGGGVALLRRRA